MLTDFERPLTQRGRINSSEMSKALNEQKILPDIIFSSPANRALTTARIFSSELSYPLGGIIVRESIYEAGTEDLLELIKSFDNQINSAMLFGHNPGFIMLAQELTNSEIEFFPTCTIFGMELQINSWNEISAGTGKCFLFKSPKRDLLK